jgi:hypothetical protein
MKVQLHIFLALVLERSDAVGNVAISTLGWAGSFSELVWRVWKISLFFQLGAEL